MKELSIEQKARRYDEALERAKELLEVGLKDTRDKRVVLSFFPELAESEDERIRKDIISYLQSSTAVSPKTWIEWLEKQGKQKTWSEDDEAILSWCISDIERAKYCRSQTNPELCDIEINWLKSSVGCDFKHATTWKPSEDEMKALEFCLEYNIDKDGVFGSKVVKLYDELKKLK